MRMQAAVLWEPGRPVEILDVELAPPQAGEVLVRMAACGVCHSDLHVIDGDLPEPLPLVLGHEAAGVVTEVGPGVERVEPGDHVVLALVPSCGDCESCRAGRPNFCEQGARMASTGTLADGTSRLSLDGTVLRHFNAVSSFAEHAVVPESVAVPIRDDVPLDLAALIGCAVLTGWGGVTRTAGVEPGATVAVIGCGGVGDAAVVGARLAGAAKIIAVDIDDRKLETAQRMGATHTVNSRAGDAVEAIRELTGGFGADVVIEAVGRPETYEQAFYARDLAGTVVLVGVPTPDMKLELPLLEVFGRGGALKSSWYGDCLPSRDFPMLIDLHQQGRIDLGAFVTETIGLGDVEKAFARMHEGDVLRSVVQL